MSESVFLTGLAIVGSALVLTARAIAAAISGRGSSRETARIREQVEQNSAALEDAQHILAQQAAQLSELQERVDFAERLLAQSPDRVALKPGEEGG